VEGRTYKNASIGIEFTPDPKLRFGVPELKGKPGTAPSSVTVAAWGELRPYSVPEGTTFLATALASYPEKHRSTDGCVRMLIQANQRNGWKALRGSEGYELGGVLFARTDFFRAFEKGSAYEATFVKACDTKALVFVFVSSGREAVDKLISSTELTLDLPTSGCLPDIHATRTTPNE